MPKVKLDVGATIDFLNKDELDDALTDYQKNAQAAEYEKLKGLKFIRLPRLYATPASGTVRLGEAWAGNLYTDQIMGPNQGYIWSIRRLVVTGLGTGTSPDVINFYRNGISGETVWQLNGNSFGQTFGKNEMVLLPDEKLIAQSVGSMTSTSQIVISGDAIEVPALMIGKLILWLSSLTRSLRTSRSPPMQALPRSPMRSMTLRARSMCRRRRRPAPWLS